MVHRIAANPITLSDVQGHSATASVFRCDFSYIGAAVDNASRSPSAIAELFVQFSSFQCCNLHACLINVL